MKSNRASFLASAWKAALLPAMFAATVAQAQVPTGPVSLADVPLFATISVKPNVMFTLDNSGSMAWAFAPMWVDDQWGRNCTTAHTFNNLYYNPANDYFPPVRADGTRYPNASYTAAWRDGYFTADGTVNLSNKYSNVGSYDLGGGHSTGSRGGFYHVYNGAGVPNPSTCYANGSYTLVDINSASAAQQQNFANWFSYYRTRVNAMKTSVGEAFRTIDDTFRVGFHTINNPQGGGSNGTFLPVDTFTGAHRTAWYDAFYGQRMGSGTPLRAAQWRIGEYYRAGTSPRGGTVADPIQFTCQQNYHILSTDGQWNGAMGSGTIGNGNWDNSLPNDPMLLAALGKEFNTTFTAGSPWPRPYRENPSQTSTGNLSDLAAYYWMTDLRPTMGNNVPTSAGDPASWQHMVTFGVAFSEQGSIAYPGGLAAIRSGAAEWPRPTNDSPSAVDDLWHSALVGHGQYFNVTSPAQLMDALGRALNEIRVRSGSASGAQFSSTDLTVPGSSVAYRTGFSAGDWTGEVGAYGVDAATGTVEATPIWSARTRLETLVAPAGAGGGWDLQRKIATYRPDTKVGVPFRWGNLSSTQQASIDANAAKGQRVVNYLRGDRANEDGPGIVREFRQRPFVLGDIVYSEPVYTGKPKEGYSDAFNAGYESFKTSKASRRPMIYVGSNDGMLHAIDATTGMADSGKEIWAYVPGLSYRAGVEGLAGLSYRFSDPLPNRFGHRFRVDQTPTVRDVDFSATSGSSGSGDWRTLLVAGMNKGGRGYYALDVTNPEAASEAAVGTKVLWEFSGEVANDPKMGYTYGEPQIFKTRRFGWVVAVSSGYNNAAGTGHVWLLHPRTGAVLHRFDSGVGNAGIPSGLAHFEIFMQSSKEAVAEQLYAVDLMGNVHRFDVSSVTAGDWTTTGTKVASVNKPLTSRPAIALNPFNQSERWLFFGSGRLLDIGDMTSAAVPSMYAIRDGNATTPATFTSPRTATDLTLLGLTDSFVSTSTTKGWYMNLNASSHILGGPYLARGNVIWSTTAPTSDACSAGATSNIYARAISDGGNRIASGTSITTTSQILKLQTVAVSNSGAVNSQKKFRLNTSKSDGTADGTGDVDLTFSLIGGRTGVRFIAAQ